MSDLQLQDSDPLTVRTLLHAIVLVGVLGMGIELVLIGHVDGVLQFVPLALLGTGLVALAWYGVAPGSSSARSVQVVMAAFVVSGLWGIILHYNGNREFELEMYPTMAGFELVRETLSGATPVLAPGSLTLLGLTGFVVVSTPRGGRGRRSR